MPLARTPLGQRGGTSGGLAAESSEGPGSAISMGSRKSRYSHSPSLAARKEQKNDGNGHAMIDEGEDQDRDRHNGHPVVDRKENQRPSAAAAALLPPTGRPAAAKKGGMATSSNDTTALAKLAKAGTKGKKKSKKSKKPGLRRRVSFSNQQEVRHFSKLGASLVADSHANDPLYAPRRSLGQPVLSDSDSEGSENEVTIKASEDSNKADNTTGNIINNNNNNGLDDSTTGPTFVGDETRSLVPGLMHDTYVDTTVPLPMGLPGDSDASTDRSTSSADMEFTGSYGDAGDNTKAWIDAVVEGDLLRFSPAGSPVPTDASREGGSGGLLGSFASEFSGSKSAANLVPSADSVISTDSLLGPQQGSGEGGNEASDQEFDEFDASQFLDDAIEDSSGRTAVEESEPVMTIPNFEADDCAHNYNNSVTMAQQSPAPVSTQERKSYTPTLADLSALNATRGGDTGMLTAGKFLTAMPTLDELCADDGEDDITASQLTPSHFLRAQPVRPVDCSPPLQAHQQAQQQMPSSSSSSVRDFISATESEALERQKQIREDEMRDSLDSISLRNSGRLNGSISMRSPSVSGIMNVSGNDTTLGGARAGTLHVRDLANNMLEGLTDTQVQIPEQQQHSNGQDMPEDDDQSDEDTVNHVFDDFAKPNNNSNNSNNAPAVEQLSVDEGRQRDFIPASGKMTLKDFLYLANVRFPETAMRASSIGMRPSAHDDSDDSEIDDQDGMHAVKTAVLRREMVTPEYELFEGINKQIQDRTTAVLQQLKTVEESIATENPEVFRSLRDGERNETRQLKRDVKKLKAQSSRNEKTKIYSLRIKLIDAPLKERLAANVGAVRSETASIADMCREMGEIQMRLDRMIKEQAPKAEVATVLDADRQREVLSLKDEIAMYKQSMAALATMNGWELYELSQSRLTVRFADRFDFAVDLAVGNNGELSSSSRGIVERRFSLVDGARPRSCTVAGDLEAKLLEDPAIAQIMARLTNTIDFTGTLADMSVFAGRIDDIVSEVERLFGDGLNVKLVKQSGESAAVRCEFSSAARQAKFFVTFGGLSPASYPHALQWHFASLFGADEGLQAAVEGAAGAVPAHAFGRLSKVCRAVRAIV
jgi:Spc7 kinetochore protein